MLEKVWRKGMLLHCWWECKLVQPLWKIVWSFLKKKLKLEMPYDPARLRQWHPTPVLLPGKSHGWRSLEGCSPTPRHMPRKKKKTVIKKDTCTCLFIAALFTKAKTWKQPKCPLTDTMDHRVHASQVASVMSSSLQPYGL